MSKLNLLLLFLLLATATHAQVIYEPLNSEIYDYLDRMNIGGLIELDSEAKPFSRNYIAEKLQMIDSQSNKLNIVEREELDWYSREYKYELNRQDIPARIRLYEYSDSSFHLMVSPIGAYGKYYSGKYSSKLTRFGIHVAGSVSDWFGAVVHMNDTEQMGSNVDKDEYLTSNKGHPHVYAPDGIGYSEVSNQINVSWNWGSISLSKEYAEWGNAYFGNIILSDKAPSYPKISISIKPVDWLRINWQHGWIHSGIIDSSFSHINPTNSENIVAFEKFIKKYFVANLITVSPFRWMDISLGNSHIYAGDLRPEMFLPFGFYKYFDRETGKASQEDGNGSLFGDIAVRYPQNYKFYSSFYLEVANLRKLLNNEPPYLTWFGYTVGVKRVNLIFNNLDFILEYTRMNPWVYEHRLEVTNYKHLDYSLGHWLGQNADHFRIQADYQFIRGLKFKLYFERVRKGGLLNVDDFGYNDDVDEPFLYGLLREDIYLGFETQYEIIHEFFIKGIYKYSVITDEDNLRTPDWMLGKNHNLSIELYYGLR